MATYALTVNGVTKTLQPDGLRINETANGRNTFSLSMFSADGSYRPPARGEVIFTEDGTRIFGGHIVAPAEAGLGGLGVVPILTTIQADDFNAYASRRTVTGVIPAGTLKAALQWFEPYLTPYGVALDVAQVNGPTLPAFTFDALVLADALNQVCAAAGWYVWEIDYTETLRAFLPASTAAPFDVVDGDGHAIGDIQVQTITDYYANRIVLRWLSAAVSAWAYLELTGQAGDGETVTIGSRTYTWQTVLTDVDGHVLIGATSDDSLSNLAAAVNLSSGAGTLYAASMTAQTAVTAYAGGGYWGSVFAMRTVALSPGTSGNSIGVSTNAANGVWRGEGRTSTATTLENGADQALTNYVIAEDLTEQASVGIFEKTLSDETILSADVAQAVADGALAQALIDLKEVRYRTFETGVHPGQTQTITCAARNLSGSFIVTDVAIVRTAGNVLARDVTAYGGTLLPYRWQDDARVLFGGSGSSAGSAGFTVLSGGVSITTPFPLGGARDRAIACGTTETPVLDYQTYEAPSSFTATVRVEVKARVAAVAVTPSLYNVTDAARVSGSPITATSFTSQDIPVSLLSGKVYRLEVVTDTAGAEAYGIGKLVA